MTVPSTCGGNRVHQLTQTDGKAAILRAQRKHPRLAVLSREVGDYHGSATCSMSTWKPRNVDSSVF